MHHTPSVKVTTSLYWRELDTLIEERKLPPVLAQCLKDLIGNHEQNSVRISATPELIELCKIHLKDGILIRDSGCELLYDVMVFVPTENHSEKNQMFFRLMPKYPGGEFKYPKDVDLTTPAEMLPEVSVFELTDRRFWKNRLPDGKWLVLFNAHTDGYEFLTVSQGKNTHQKAYMVAIPTTLVQQTNMENTRTKVLDVTTNGEIQNFSLRLAHGSAEIVEIREYKQS